MQKKNAVQWFVVVVCVVFYTFVPNLLQAQVFFPDVDLNGSNGLLFTSEVTYGDQSWKNLYRTNITEDKQAEQAAAEKPQLLNCFPQKMDTFQGGNVLQIRNADGVFMYTPSKRTLTRVSENSVLYPSPANDAKIRDNLAETAVSPDGNWLCYFKKTSPAFGTIMLFSTTTGQEMVLAQNVDFSFQSLPALWSPDSSVLVYEKDNYLYFIEPNESFNFFSVEEELRQIGEGSISNIVWASEKMLVYIQNDMVFNISINELYTRSLYSVVLGSGEIAGRLPLPFDSNKDRFWTDETGTQIVLLQGGNTLFYFQLQNPLLAVMSDYEDNQLEANPFAKTLYSHAFLPVSSSALNCTVLWVPSSPSTSVISAASESTVPLLWLEYSGRNTESYVYRLNNSSRDGNFYFEQLNVPSGASSPSLSSNKKLVAFTAISSNTSDNTNATTAENITRSLYVYDLASWQQQYVFFEEPVVSFAWKTNTSLFIGGRQTVRSWDFRSGNHDVLFLSSVNRFGWDETGTNVLASCNAGTFMYNDVQNVWTPVETLISRQNNFMNSHWRIISSAGRNSNYKNILLVRALQGESWTKPLLKEFFDTESDKPKVALAFDALDNQNGLAEILSVLSSYGVEGTFFINGEFLRRFPEAVLSILEAGYECAPMFYTTVDLLSDDFVIDEDFIRRGLAHNEDAFFALTGSDMEFFWHTPYYRYSELIEEAGIAAGYKLLKDDILSPNDTMTLEYAATQGIPYVSSSEAIEDIVPRLFDGAVIPVLVGVSNGTRPDYMYEKLDVLISAIFEAGYDIVPISEVIY